MKSILVSIFATALPVAAINATDMGENNHESKQLNQRIEIRTLPQTSLIRSQLEGYLGANRVSPDFTLKVVASDEQFPSGGSIIEMMEHGSDQKLLGTGGVINDPIEPEGPGQEGDTTSTREFCAIYRPSTGTYANYTWNWTYRANSDTNNDGDIDNSDDCPCSWHLDSQEQVFLVENQPLKC